MRALMRPLMLLVVLGVGFAASACGKEIGDACIVSSDCSTDGSRVCDMSQFQGYCTIQGCDYSTCPEEGACIRFFMGSFQNRPCNPVTENISTDDCSLDELCTLEGQCVPRSAEVRYCMRKCDTSADCRDGYECRDLDLMKAHGGEPVLAPGLTVDSSSPKFCAEAPPS
jgi:hypothetical protein